MCSIMRVQLRIAICTYCVNDSQLSTNTALEFQEEGFTIIVIPKPVIALVCMRFLFQSLQILALLVN